MVFGTAWGAPRYPVEIIHLHARTAAEIIPLIRPFIGRDGGISGMRDQLIIRTSPGNMAEIRRILKGIDRPPRRLMIYVRYGQQRTAHRQEIRGGIDVATHDGHVRIGDDPNGVRGISGHSRRNVDAQQRIQALEGRSAFIAAGAAYPILRSTVVVRNGIVYETPGIGYRTTATGFYVRPQLNGDRVTLFIRPRMERPGHQGGSFDYQTAATTVSGRLGEWITLGGIGEDRSQEQRGLLLRKSTRKQANSVITVKVVALD